MKSPKILSLDNGTYSREGLKSLMAYSVFQYPLPQLSELSADQILEVRNLITDTREGFTMYLQELSADVESRIQKGDKLQEIGRYARSVVETKIHPQYLEFTRQIRAKRGGFWGKVLEAGGRILSVDAAPWTPKFYGELLQALGVTLDMDADQQAKELTNQNQAYQFIRNVENYLIDKE